MEKKFKPNLTPKECIHAGIFGGIYFNPIGGKPGIISRRVDIDFKEFPKLWFPKEKRMYINNVYDKSINKYKVTSGKNQAFWETKGWINPQDPRGWFQWYCRYYTGRRTEDDERQIKRWIGVCGESGRWRRFLINKILERGTSTSQIKESLHDYSISPKVRQLLLHWGYELKMSDFGY